MGKTVHVVQADQLHPQPVPGIPVRAPKQKPQAGQQIIGYMLYPAEPGCCKCSTMSAGGTCCTVFMRSCHEEYQVPVYGTPAPTSAPNAAPQPGAAPPQPGMYSPPGVHPPTGPPPGMQPPPTGPPPGMQPPPTGPPPGMQAPPTGPPPGMYPPPPVASTSSQQAPTMAPPAMAMGKEQPASAPPAPGGTVAGYPVIN